MVFLVFLVYMYFHMIHICDHMKTSAGRDGSSDSKSGSINHNVFSRNVSLTILPLQVKKCLRTCGACADSNHLAHAQGLIRAFVRH